MSRLLSNSKIRFLLGLYCACIIPNLYALDLKGELVQGGLVRGKVEPGSAVFLNGKKIQVSSSGDFVFGVGRDASAQAKLEILKVGVHREVHELDVKQRQYEEQRIDGLPKNKVEPTAKELKRIWAEQKFINKARARSDERTDFLADFIWPLTGRISGVYGSRRILNGKAKNPHSGVDVAAPSGTLVVAPAAGVVSLIHQDMFYTGGTVFIQHGHGVSTMYIHLSEIFVSEGQEVKQGDKIAAVGMTGRATGPHLHWAMNWFNTRLDPALLVPPMDEVLKQEKTFLIKKQ